MLMQKAKGRLTGRLLMALLSVALVFTMMPLTGGFAYGEDADPPADPVIKGNVLKKEMTLNETTLQSILNTDDVVFKGVNKNGNLGETTVNKSVAIDDLVDLAGLKEGATIDHFVVTTNKIDGGSSAQQVTEYPKNRLLEAPDQDDLGNGKAVLGFQWTDPGKNAGDPPVVSTGTKLFLGCFQGMPVAEKGTYIGHLTNKPFWIDTLVSIEVVGTVPEPTTAKPTNHQPTTRAYQFTTKPANAKPGDKVNVGGSTFTVLSATANTVAFTKAKNAKNVTVPATVTIKGKTYTVTQIGAKAFKGKKIRKVTVGKNVKKIKAKAFKGSKATKVVVKTRLLTKKAVKGSLKGSKVKTIKVKVGKKSVNKKYVKKYKKIFTKKNAGKKVKVK